MSFARFLKDVVNQRSAGLINSLFSNVLISNLCVLSRRLGLEADAYSFARVDPQAQQTVRSFLATAVLAPLTRSRLHRLVTGAFEGSLLPALMDVKLKRLGVEEEQEEDVAKHERSIQRCILNQIIMPDVELEAVPPSHFADLILLCCYCFAAAALHLLLEIVCPSHVRRKRVRRGTRAQTKRPAAAIRREKRLVAGNLHLHPVVLCE